MSLQLNMQEHQPKYLKVRQAIKAEMESGKLKNGCCLPSEKKLADMFQVGRSTLRLALNDLRKAGLIISRQGSKSIVRNRFQTEKRLRLVWLGNAELSDIEPILTMVYQSLIHLTGLQKHYVTYWFMRNGADEKWLLQHLDEIDGIIFSNVQLADLSPEIVTSLQNSPKAVSLILGNAKNISNIITTDNYAGGAIAAEYLLSRGFRNFLVLGISPGYKDGFFNERIRGFTDQLFKEQKLLVNLQVINSDSPSDFNNVGRVLDQLDSSSYDVIYAVSDNMALKTISALQKRGLRVPEDIAVMGFDGIATETDLPALTTIGTDTDSIAEKIFSVIRTNYIGTKPQGHIKVKPHLVERDTVGIAIKNNLHNKKDTSKQNIV